MLIHSKLAGEFRCLAADCPSTCCREWNIVWHKNEVKKLALCADVGIAEKIPAAFYPNEDYYFIKHGEDNKCPFLESGGLCEIHKKLGEEYISYVCREYPRISRLFGDIMLFSCKNACYEVMDSLCRNSDSMDICRTDIIDRSAIITPDAESERYRKVFCEVSDILWSGRKLPSLYNKEGTENIFSEIFGWRLITADSTNEAEKALSEYCREGFEQRLESSMFMEFMIERFDPECSDEDNLRCFEFCFDAAKKAALGAAAAAEDRQQFICSVCDIVSFVLSSPQRIISYFKQKSTGTDV